MTEDEERSLLELRLKEAGQDVNKLRTLEALLSDRTETWVRGLRIRMIGRIHAAKTKPVVTGGFADITARYSLPAPDARWIYQYRLSDAMFEKLRADVAASAVDGRLDRNPAGAALFVLWAAEWFRRCHPGGVHRWEDLEGALGAKREQNRWRDITERGLRVWRRPLIAGATGRYFLSTLAREGGFPAAAIEQVHRGWAAEVLKLIVGALLAEVDPGEEQAVGIARSQTDKLPPVFRDDDFLILCGDLALAIVALRREADPPAMALGIPASAWLEAHRPGWRDTLPIVAGGSAGAALIDGLMAVEAQRIARGGISATRLLKRRDGIWQEVVRLELDGAVQGEVTKRLDPAAGRLRAHASGDLARALPGELALLEAPGEGETHWLARSIRRDGPDYAVPLATPIEIELRAGGRTESRICVPGGDAVRARMLVCTVSAEDGNGPSELAVRGTGSGAYRADRIVVQVPNDWTVQATAPDEIVAPLSKGVGDSSLWSVEGGAVVTTEVGDRYRLRAGQTSERQDRIELIGNSVGLVRSDALDTQLFSGPPIVRLTGGNRTASPNTMLYMRPLGSREWRKAPSPLPFGHYDLGWREAGILQDRRRVAVLPASAAISVRRTAQGARFTLSGWQACRLTPDPAAPIEIVADSDEWRTRPTQRLCRQFTARIEWPDDPNSAPLDVVLPIPCDAGIARWDGTVLDRNAVLTLADLPELIAFADGPMQLMGRLRERGGRVAPGGEMAWAFDGEMPMSVPAADIESLLLPADIDARVELGMHDGIETYWFISQFDRTLTQESAGLVATRGVVAEGTIVCGRSLARPTEELAFGPYALTDEDNHRPIALPSSIDGTWLIYLRHEKTITTRPVLYRGSSASLLPSSPLARAMSLPPPHLDPALDAFLDAAAKNDAAGREAIDDLLGLVGALDGLPPGTFRVFDRLASRPEVLAQLALAANDAYRPIILALADALPFAWCLIPRGCWATAEEAAFARAFDLLTSQGVGVDAPKYGLQMLSHSKRALFSDEPLLASILGGDAAIQTIETSAQSFLNRSVDRIEGRAGSMFRDILGEALPRYFLRLPDQCLETLDAPCAAALAANDRWRPAPVHIRRIKAAARTFPSYFAEAYAVWVEETR